MRKTKLKIGLLENNWSPIKFEEVADEIDKKDRELGGDEGKRFRKYGRPYLVASGIENGIKFIFTMSPYLYV